MMTLYEITKKFGEGQGEEMMWKTVKIVSEAVESEMPEHAKMKLVRKVYGAMSDGHYTEEMARIDIGKMYYTDANGNVHKAPYWQEEDMESAYEMYKAEIPDYNLWDFAVTMNMIASDNWCMLKKWFPSYDEKDMTEKILDMSLVWLKDEDWPSKTKIWDYLSAR